MKMSKKFINGFVSGMEGFNVLGHVLLLLIAYTINGLEEGYLRDMNSYNRYFSPFFL